MNTFRLPALALTLVSLSFSAHAEVIAPSETVMTSAFFIGANTVRGYAADNRPVLRVSTAQPFGLTGAETIYLTFGADFSAYSGPVTATLTLQSVAGGQGADASAERPFTVSAHGVSANPLTTIIDDTNPAGTVSWLSFYNNNILAADAAARTTVTGFGAVSFDVSALVNSWISGASSVQAIALTGKNDSSGLEFLHGFLNNANAPGSTFLTVTAVPEPGTYALMGLGLFAVGAAARRKAQAH